MAREKFTEEELGNAVFTTAEHNKKEKQNKITIYTIYGKHEIIDTEGYPVIFDENSDNAYAKKEGDKFFIKSNGSRLADPLGIYGGTDLNKKIGDHSVWKWRSTSPKIFELFIRFLKTKNKSYYLNATREML